MGVIPPDLPRQQTMRCSICGKESAVVTETREPIRLCVPPTEGRAPGKRWVRFEPCGHET